MRARASNAEGDKASGGVLGVAGVDKQCALLLLAVSVPVFRKPTPCNQQQH